MANYWIFPVTDAKVGTEKKMGVEIYEKRMSDKFWGLSERSQNRKRLEKGDHVVFYLGGRMGQKFLGTCTLRSGFYKLRRREKKKLWYGQFYRADHGVNLTDVEKWDMPVPINKLMGRLKFIKNPEEYETYLQGSIRAISEHDYNVILSEAGSEKITELSDEKEPKLTDKSSTTKVNRRTRDVAFREKIKEMYEFSCVVCGKRRFTRSKTPEVESAHIYPKEKNGSDDLRNGIALCKLHHWAFGEGLFSIKDDYSIVVEKRIRNDKNYKEINCFENKSINLPKEKKFKPHPIFLRAHRKIHGFEY